jgi:hypothetical protein
VVRSAEDIPKENRNLKRIENDRRQNEVDT